MSRSPFDVVKVNAMGLPDDVQNVDFNFQDWTSLSIKTSIVAPAEASFELGDDSGWERVNLLCQLGALFIVMVDDRPRMMGRVEALTSASDADQSTVQSFVIRTRLSDAMYSSAPQGIRLKRASIKAFVLACYEGIGLTERDFDFRGDVSRDLMTGKASRGGRPPLVLEPLTEEQAKVNPPETVYGAVDRHLRRHGMLHWDGADGRIVVSRPDDTQDAFGTLRSRRAPYGQANNIASAERTMDVSQSPTELGIFGVGGGVSFAKAKVSKIVFNEDLRARGFRRTAIIIDEAVKTKKLAGARAAREFALRNRGLDRITVTVDGLSYREGSELLPWAHDTVVEVIIDALGGAIGNYYVEDVEMTRNASAGDRTKLGLVRQGVWVL